jgi:pimeloyl-ACP methyl ester carboxylesterase
MSVSTGNTASAAIRSFTVPVTPEAELQDLRARVTATRWPDKEPVADHSQGVQLAAIQELARYWAAEYNWRACEERLGELPHFLTEIDGLDIHFIHVRSRHEDALPVVITHGWPGSVIELLKVIEPLTDPAAHGGSASDAFHVVLPSLPGHGFSGKPATTGWDTDRIARAWTVLMKRLGYSRFVAQGGDWGALVTDVMALQAPPELIGMHSNMPRAVPREIAGGLPAGAPPPAGLSAEERRAYDQLVSFYGSGTGYAQEMGTQPQTLYGIADSPVGLAAWMMNHDPSSYAKMAGAFSGQQAGDLSRDDVLDDVTLYWLTNTGVSSGRLYWENKLGFFDASDVAIPAALSVFPDELYQAPRSWAEQSYQNLIYYNQLDRGGHFAAWEQPRLFAQEIRAGFRPLR